MVYGICGNGITMWYMVCGICGIWYMVCGICGIMVCGICGICGICKQDMDYIISTCLFLLQGLIEP